MFNTLPRSAIGAGMMLALMALSACGTAGAQSSATEEAKKKVAVGGGSGNTSGSTSGGSTTSTTPPTTTVMTPPAAGDVLSPNGTKGEFDVADNFDVSSTLLAAAGAVGTSPDAVGAFRFTCLAGQISRDDPIVYPAQPGKSHLHQFFGNTGTNADSTYTSLRTTGGSTCTRSANPTSQRTAYWMPAMLDGAGNAVKPDWINTYYKEIPNGDLACAAAPDATHLGHCIPIPNGLRYVMGYNMATGAGGPADMNSMDQWKMGFDCGSREPGGVYSYTGPKHTITEILATGLCPAGSWLRVYITFPDCWDGVHLDTADHRSHMAYADGAVIEGERACPADHPYKIPEVAVSAFFTTESNFTAGKWHLASDEMVPGTVPGSTLHMDYWEAWSPVVKSLWQANCIDRHLSCSIGELGQGQMVNGMQQYGTPAIQPKVSLSTIP